MKVGEYYYTPNGRQFRIYQCDYSDGKIETGKPVYKEPLFNNREDARKRVYELNGWHYKARESK